MMRELHVTRDGSHTLQLINSEVTYHSRYGAIQESEHVYIGAGLQPFIGNTEPVRIFEMGFGTGLNAFLAYLEAREAKVKIEYEAVEAFPLVKEEYKHLNYAQVMGKKELCEAFQMLHQTPWNRTIRIGSWFSLVKHQANMLEFATTKKFHVIFYDAFAPTAQPELWTEDALGKMYNLLQPNGILTTYCSKGEVRRNLEAVGFSIEKLPGPYGKREMLRAHKALD
ncbi:MAG: tRNA (5-methylaminomethyl-2-thiouridine)(34)-methyltransferase MnmD [Bacteroidetes bacterium]|uniref:tRNA (5-methylaminomethyl-2-thiouridine)(34)-methyltransferase MnmD n=1 Tax=Phnomibacter sp. TaxID=2836217 RepID=UPI002FDD19E5|nr:tRNA (5-methylaminomethyl-2-thiouridine)(34)-methyltransferase MnmD [Bacteroidota bacterium]